MSITAKVILCAVVGAAGVGGYLYTRARPEIASDPAEVAKSEPPPAEPAAHEPWGRRRQQIERALAARRAGGSDAPVATDPDQAATARLDRRFRAFRELVQTCVEDLGSGHVGALTLSVHEIGAPDVGTIYDSIEVVHSNVDDPQTLECIVQSMYAYSGEAPPEPFERSTVRTIHVGEPRTPDAKTRQIAGFVFGAHMGEVRFCGTRSDDVEGTVTYALTIADDGSVATSSPGPTDLPPEVIACITAATKRWRFPKSVAGQTLEQTLTLPVAGEFPGMTTPDSAEP